MQVKEQVTWVRPWLWQYLQSTAEIGDFQHIDMEDESYFVLELTDQLFSDAKENYIEEMGENQESLDSSETIYDFMVVVSLPLSKEIAKSDPTTVPEGLLERKLDLGFSQSNEENNDPTLVS